jgi:predicted ATPase/DNA-binding CsgD family transcriptional regulator
MAGQFADGAAFVPLEAIRDDDLVPGAVALALGIPEQPGRDTADILAGVLASRHLLLVLDNCEQVVGAAPFVAHLLTRCPRLRVLATSRMPFTIAGEQQVRIAPLPVPAPGEPRTAAVDLFIDRGLAVNLDLALDEPTLAAITEICRRLDGLPLAIELAAARVAVLTPQHLLMRLTHSLTVLTGGRADAPPRLRSMRDAIGWSYDLLAPDAQRLLRRASVFLGGFSLEAAAFVMAWPDPSDETAAIELVQMLIDQNLAQAVPGAVEPRFRMLETIREFGQQAAERLGDAGDSHLAHAEYVLGLAVRAERPLLGPDQDQWLDRLETEYPNILAAIDWLADHGRPDAAAALTSAIHWFLLIRAHHRDLIERLEFWRDRQDLVDLGRGQVLHVLGVLKPYTGAASDAVAMLQEAADIFRDAGGVWHEAVALAALSRTYHELDDMERLPSAVASSIERSREAGYHRGVHAGTAMLAWIAMKSGDVEGARRLRDEAYRTGIRHGDLWFLANHLRGRAYRAAEASHFDEAEAMAAESTALINRLGARHELVLSLHQRSVLSLARGDLEAATRHIDHAYALAQSSGYGSDLRWLRVSQATVALAREDFAAAREAVVTLLQGLDAPRRERLDTGACLEVFTVLAARIGDITLATRYYAAAIQLVRETGVNPSIPDTIEEIYWLQREIRSALGQQGLERADCLSASIDVDAVIAAAMSWELTASATGPSASERPFGLSPREREVLRLMAAGRTNQQIADELFISVRTAANHVGSILTKLEVPSRTAAVSCAIREGFA